MSESEEKIAALEAQRDELLKVLCHLTACCPDISPEMYSRIEPAVEKAEAVIHRVMEKLRSDPYNAPWTFDGDGAIRGKNGNLVAGLWGSTEQCRLIAAAPKLLDACRQLVAGFDAPDSVEIYNAYEAALQAIAEVEKPS